jgi:DNA-binding protein YbaB
MFDKLKDLKKLRDLDCALAKEQFETEKEGIKITINGRGEIISIFLNPDLSKEKQEQILVSAINEVCGQAKMAMAKKAAEISGLGF